MVSFFKTRFLFFFFVPAVLKLKCAAAARLCSRSVNAKGSPVSCLTLSVVAHIVRLVMPHSKRLLLSRGYLIVRGRWCFQESLFWPIKVAVNLGTSCRNLPFSSWLGFSHSASHCCSLSHQHFNVQAAEVLECCVCFVWLGRRYRSEVCARVSGRREMACSSCLHVKIENGALPKTCQRR